MFKLQDNFYFHGCQWISYKRNRLYIQHDKRKINFQFLSGVLQQDKNISHQQNHQPYYARETSENKHHQPHHKLSAEDFHQWIWTWHHQQTTILNFWPRLEVKLSEYWHKAL